MNQEFSGSHEPSTQGTSFSRPLLEGKLDLDSAEWDDIHVVTGALKLFFRELPQPLVPALLLPDFRDALGKGQGLQITPLTWVGMQ